MILQHQLLLIRARMILQETFCNVFRNTPNTKSTHTSYMGEILRGVGKTNQHLKKTPTFETKYYLTTPSRKI